MKWILLALILPGAALAQGLPPVPAIDAARAAARAVDQTVQTPRTGRESMDRTAPLLTVEPHADPATADADEAARRKAREAKADEEPAPPAARPQRD